MIDQDVKPKVIRLIPRTDAEIEMCLKHESRTWVMLGYLFGRGYHMDLPPALTVDEARTIIRAVLQDMKVRENA